MSSGSRAFFMVVAALGLPITSLACGSADDPVGSGPSAIDPNEGTAGGPVSSAGGSSSAPSGSGSSGSGGAQSSVDHGSGGSVGSAGSVGTVASGGAAGAGATGAGGSSVMSGSGACSGSGIAVYTDATNLLQLAWKGHGAFKENASGGCEGSKSYEYDWSVESYWDGLLLNLTKPIDASKASAFTYAYKQGPSDPNFFFVRLHSGAKACGAGCDVEVHAGSADWKVVTIPISTFVKSGEVDLTAISAIEFGFSGPDASGTLLLDGVMFTQ
jgi:hypothetical protein